jgi:hypothetical protein
MEILNGKLPWTLLRDPEATTRMKRTLGTAEICDGMPNQALRIWDYLNCLEFAQEPDYRMLKDLLREMLKSVPATERQWDWEHIATAEIEPLSPISLKMPDNSHVEVDDLDGDIGCSCNVM